MLLEQIFTTVVAVDQLDTIDNEKLREFCLNEVYKSVSYKERNDTQTDYIDAHVPELADLVDIITQRTNELHVRLGYSPLFKQKIERCWINLNDPLETRVPHQHAQTAFTCVYYVSGNEQSGKIKLMNPNASKNQVILPKHLAEHNTFTSSAWGYQPLPGRLVIFPGWTYHYVERNQDDSERISIAFDSVFEEYTLNNNATPVQR